MPGWPLRFRRGTGWGPEWAASLLPGQQGPGGHCSIPRRWLQLVGFLAGSPQQRAFPGAVGFCVCQSLRVYPWEVSTGAGSQVF